MITIKEAKEILSKNITTMPFEDIDLKKSLGFVLAKSVYSNLNLPPFSQSAMDGYAVRFDIAQHREMNIRFEVLAEIKAGDTAKFKLKLNQAARIFTGAPIPAETIAVIMQEKVKLEKGQVVIAVTDLKPGINIRSKGTQIKKGALALEKGAYITPAAMGYLFALGESKIRVIKKPVASILSTGNELQLTGKLLLPGKIYESNSGMLNAALVQNGFKASKLKTSKDNAKTIKTNLAKMLEVSNVIIITGGISVGKYDLVKDILLQLGVKELFYKVAQKPGKPLFLGRLKDKLIFALPGNPAAALVCFYEYVLPALRKMSGIIPFDIEKVYLPLLEAYAMKGDRDVFLKAQITNQTVKILDGQESNMLHSFAIANAIVYLPAGNNTIEKGTLVETHLLF